MGMQIPARFQRGCQDGVDPPRNCSPTAVCWDGMGSRAGRWGRAHEALIPLRTSEQMWAYCRPRGMPSTWEVPPEAGNP